MGRALLLSKVSVGLFGLLLIRDAANTLWNFVIVFSLSYQVLNIKIFQQGGMELIPNSWKRVCLMIKYVGNAFDLLPRKLTVCFEKTESLENL